MNPGGSTVPAYVASQAAEAPCAVALIDGAHTLTYAELENRSNVLARYLRLLGTRRDSVIGVCLPRSIAQIVASLAVMKAGAAYLPLDPDLPEERFCFAIRDSGAEIVIGYTNAHGVAARTDAPRMVSLRSDGSFGSDGSFEGAGFDELDLPVVLPDDLAYVIYTSGSTGRPKGVEIPHRGLANLIGWHRSTFGVCPQDRASFLSSVGFDAAVWEVWPYLSSGASVHIAGDSAARDPAALRDWLLANAITIAFVSTPIAERLIELRYPADTALRVLLTGADTLHRYPTATLPFALYNNYGPTEASVVATSGLVEPLMDAARLPSIGRPITNTQIYLLAADGTPVADGREGEICIAGPGLARGYRGRPDLTSERFRWYAWDEQPAIRVYHTGDRGRRSADGQIAFLGRIDDQVKIRGFRVEPREIEIALNACVGVRESAVVVRDFGPGDDRLVAYVVARPGARLVLGNIQDSLNERLPAYMIPATFVELPALPLTTNGKVDRADLRARAIGTRLGTETFIAPRSRTEERLTELVGELLKLERVGVDDDFFLLGGHSLLGTQLIARLRDTFGVRIGLRFLFESPTISALAVEVERQRSERVAPVGGARAPEPVLEESIAPIGKRRA